MKKVKELKKWNGRAPGKKGSVYIAAYTKKQAVEFWAKFAGYTTLDNLIEGRGQRELKVYFSECWGNPMEGIKPEPGLWYSKQWEKPKKIL